MKRETWIAELYRRRTRKTFFLWIAWSYERDFQSSSNRQINAQPLMETFLCNQPHRRWQIDRILHNVKDIQDTWRRKFRCGKQVNFSILYSLRVVYDELLFFLRKHTKFLALGIIYLLLKEKMGRRSNKQSRSGEMQGMFSGRRRHRTIRPDFHTFKSLCFQGLCWFLQLPCKLQQFFSCFSLPWLFLKSLQTCPDCLSRSLFIVVLQCFKRYVFAMCWVRVHKDGK